jgi:uncharacterized protein (UPF0276 family)
VSDHGTSTPQRPSGPLPARAGIGLRAIHHDDFLKAPPQVGWVEAHAENYFAAGGAQPWYLEQVRQRFPLSLHGVGLSLGSADPLDPTHLAHWRRLIDRFEPALVSEHLCWSGTGGLYSNDLLPLPYTRAALKHLVSRVQQAQESLRRQLLIENVSSYLEFESSDMTEWDFLTELARRSGCGILLDVNNVYVSACNHSFDARRYIDAIPAAAIGEIHLAGHSINRAGNREIRIDTHSTAVCNEVWALYEYTIRRNGYRPTLIEWDTDIPALGVLAAEATLADRHASTALAKRAKPLARRA